MVERSTPDAPPRGRTRRQVVAAGAAGTAAAACTLPGGQATGTAAGKLPEQPITLQVGWEAPSNLLTQFEQGTGKELFEQRYPTIKLEFSTLGSSGRVTSPK
jgi:hypothetical protein